MGMTRVDKMLVFLVLFSTGVVSQQCVKLDIDPAEGSSPSVFFGTFTASGSMEGLTVVANSVVLSDINLGTQISSGAGFVCGGDVDFRCGSIHGNLFYGGSITLGPRVDLNGYVTTPADISTIYDHSLALTQFRQLSTLAFDVVSAGISSRQGAVVRLIGSGQSTEIFEVSCSDLGAAETVWFQQLVHTTEQPITIIINVVVDNDVCKMDFSGASGWRGLDFPDAGGRIVWNFQSRNSVTLELYNTVLGSILAPLADIQSHDCIVEGQIVANSLNGSVFGRYEPFNGCIPTDPCAIQSHSCPTPVQPNNCIEGELVVDPENNCCEQWHCLDSCDEISTPCSTLDLFECPPPSVAAISFRAGVEGGDPCCDTYSCVDPGTSCEHCLPVKVSCPEDITLTIASGQTDVRHRMEYGSFLFVSPSNIVSYIYKSAGSGWVTASSPTSEYYYFTAGVYLVMTKATNAVESVHCNYEVKVLDPVSLTGGCIVDGVSYENHAVVRDGCDRVCVCAGGRLQSCTRERPELQTMGRDQRALFFRTFLAAYDAPDQVLVDMINDHVMFFSRGLHNNGAFLPWHRGYLLSMESRLREVDCRVTLPFWDWTLVPRVSAANFWGLADHQASHNGGRDRCVTGGTFGFPNFALTNGRCLMRRITGSSTATEAALETQLFSRFTQSSQYDQFRNRLEHGPGMHDSVHCIVGGTMCSARSSNDVVFWTHHANIDYIWSLWQAQGPDFLDAYTGNTARNQLMPVSVWTPAEMLDMTSLGGSISVIYASEASDLVRHLLGMMNEEEISSIDSVGVGVVGQEWLDAMDMPGEQQRNIREVEAFTNQHVVQEVIAMTLSNGLERGLQMPGLEEATRQLVLRLSKAENLAFAFETGSVELEDLWTVLQFMFADQNIVPTFYEIQDVLVEYLNDNGEVEGTDTITVPVPVGCGPGPPVCANGINFPNQCVAESRGFFVTNNGLCPLPPTPQTPLSPEIDNGDSEAYNHGQQELAICPDSAPSHSLPCSVDHVVCFYGITCCSDSIPTTEITATCVDGSWFIVNYQWNGDCAQALCDVELSPEPPTTPPPTSRPTRSPTPLPVTEPPTPSLTLPPTYAQVFTRPPTPQRASPPRRTWLDSRPVFHGSRPTTTVSITSSDSEIILDTQPTTGISNSECARLTCGSAPTCCEVGSSVGTPPTNINCDYCPTCVSDTTGLRTVVPPCCSPPITVCSGPPTCDEGEVASIMADVGAHGALPCCPRYTCQCPLCPTLEDATCSNGRVPRFASAILGEESYTNTGCRECRIIRCVVDFCPSTRTYRCPNGDIRSPDPTSIPPCQFFACTDVCPNANEEQHCPAAGNTLVRRGRNMVPQINLEDQTVVCPWEPCPEYEPCDDVLRNQRLCSGNGVCQRGNTRRIVCDCNQGWDGEFCDNLVTPPRIRYPTYTRSFSFDSSNCLAFMCYPSNSGRGCYIGSGESNFEEWTLVPGAHTFVIFATQSDSVVVYWATDEGFLMMSTVQIVRNGLSVTSEMEGANIDNGSFQRLKVFFDDREEVFYDTFSYRTVDNELPSPSEYRFVVNSDVPLNTPSSCSWWIYLTEKSVVFYHASGGVDIMVRQSWFEDDQGETFLVSTTTELCDDLCIEDGVTNVCSDHGVCDRSTGHCQCYFGFSGEFCSQPQ